MVGWARNGTHNKSSSYTSTHLKCMFDNAIGKNVKKHLKKSCMNYLYLTAYSQIHVMNTLPQVERICVAYICNHFLFLFIIHIFFLRKHTHTHMRANITCITPGKISYLNVYTTSAKSCFISTRENRSTFLHV